MRLDTVCLVETPEGTDLHAELAGLVPRALAYSIDFLLRMVIIIALSIVLAVAGRVGDGLLLIAFFVLEWGYPIFFEVFRGGQTVGKKAFNIKVVNEDLTPIRFGPSLIRNLLRTADLFPFLYVFGSISMMMTNKFQRLGDLAAKTVVVYSDPRSHDAAVLTSVEAVVPSYPIGEDQQTAFINFALNRGHLSIARQQEIAEIIRPRMPMRVSNATAYVRGVGKWLLGAK